jgi:penicillin-binding protein 1C
MSAVKVARALGIEDFCELLQRLDLVDEKPASADRYGLGIAIGNVEVSLYQLVQAYTALARLGHYRPLMVVQGDRPPATPVLSPETAYTISDILADSSARVLTFGNPSYFDFGFPVSLKTGTSSNHRDAWAIAYTSRHVIGMWAGNFDGRATSGVTGSAACGPMVKEVVDFLYGTVKPACFERPSGVRQVLICGMSGELATENCPHKTSDLVVGRNEPPRCRLPHHNEYHYLGGAYASWIHRRESELGPGRFRLTDPSLVSDGGPWWGYGYSRHAEPPPAGRNCRIEIVSPHDRDHFVLSPYHPNRILFRAVPQPVVEQVVWFVDGVEIARTPPPYEWFWGATRGRHVVHAVTPAKEADRVTIYVE